MPRSSVGRLPVDHLLQGTPVQLAALPGIVTGDSDLRIAPIVDLVESCSDTNSPTGSSNSGSGRAAAVADDFRDSLSDTSAAFGRLSAGGSARGSIETAGDHDVFAISLTAGQTYTFNLTGGGAGGNADTVLRLLNGSGTQLAVNDDFGNSLFSRISYTATSSGTFYLDASSYGRGTGSYTLSATGSAPPPAPGDDFRDSLTDTTAPFGQVGTGTPVTGRIETGGDKDVFAINMTAGKTYTIDLAGSGSGGLADPMLRLLNGSGTQLAMNDDFGGGRNSQITFQATSSGTYYLEAKGYAASQTGAYTLSAKSVDTTPTPPTPPPSNGGFDIVINYSGDAQYQSLFDRAAARWEQVITTDLPDFNSRTAGRVDDLVINARISAIDGAGHILGQAGPTESRPGSLLTAVGSMTFDSADFATLDNAFGVILHEMGHVLGIGTHWSDLGLIDNAFHYTGANAVREYRTLSGNPNATSVPVEDQGQPGTINSHWDEETFRSEVMTGYASGAMEISRMTIGALQDLGYGVNYAAADPYTLPGSLNALMSASDTASHEIFGIV